MLYTDYVGVCIIIYCIIYCIIIKTTKLMLGVEFVRHTETKNYDVIDKRFIFDGAHL